MLMRNMISVSSHFAWRHRVLLFIVRLIKLPGRVKRHVHNQCVEVGWWLCNRINNCCLFSQGKSELLRLLPWKTVVSALRTKTLQTVGSRLQGTKLTEFFLYFTDYWHPSRHWTIFGVPFFYRSYSIFGKEEHFNRVLVTLRKSVSISACPQ